MIQSSDRVAWFNMIHCLTKIFFSFDIISEEPSVRKSECEKLLNWIDEDVFARDFESLEK